MFLIRVKKWPVETLSKSPTILRNYYYLSRLGYVYVSTGYRRWYGYSYSSFGGAVTGLLKSYSAIVINTANGAWLHDWRTHIELLCNAYEAGAEIRRPVSGLTAPPTRWWATTPTPVSTPK